MELREIRALKYKLENDITELLREFKAKTKLMPMEIEIGVMELIDHQATYYGFKSVRVKLEDI